MPATWSHRSKRTKKNSSAWLLLSLAHSSFLLTPHRDVLHSVCHDDSLSLLREKREDCRLHVAKMRRFFAVVGHFAQVLGTMRPAQDDFATRRESTDGNCENLESPLARAPP